MASLISIVESALTGVASAVPDAACRFAHGAEAGTAIRSSSVVIGGEAASESGAVEKMSVIVAASDFPTLDSDDFVSVGDEPHIVTSLRTDPINATYTVGLSDVLTRVAASITGVRGSRSVRFSMGLLAVNNGLSADVADGYAPTTVYSWTLVVSADDWPEVEPPRIGDDVRFEKRGEEVHVRVARCAKRGGYFVINARSR